MSLCKTVNILGWHISNMHLSLLNRVEALDVSLEYLADTSWLVRLEHKRLSGIWLTSSCQPETAVQLVCTSWIQKKQIIETHPEKLDEPTRITLLPFLFIPHPLLLRSHNPKMWLLPRSNAVLINWLCPPAARFCNHLIAFVSHCSLVGALMIMMSSTYCRSAVHGVQQFYSALL